MNVPDHTDFSFVGSYTIDVWVYFVGIGTDDGLLQADGGGEGHHILGTLGNSGGTGIAWASSYAWNVETPSGILTTGQWYHIAAVKDGTTSAKVYIDGEEKASDNSISDPNDFTEPIELVGKDTE